MVREFTDYLEARRYARLFLTQCDELTASIQNICGKSIVSITPINNSLLQEAVRNMKKEKFVDR